MITTHNVHYNEAMKTPQFYLLWGAVFGNAVAGVSIISCAKTMMHDIFAAALPGIVTGGFAAGFVMALRSVAVPSCPMYCHSSSVPMEYVRGVVSCPAVLRICLVGSAGRQSLTS
jgi:hypothetical protein